MPPIGLMPGCSAWADETDARHLPRTTIANLPNVCDWKYVLLQWTVSTILLERKSPRKANKIK